MKKLMMLILAMMLCVPVVAEEQLAVPVEIITGPANGHIALETALTKALQALPVQPESYQTRAEMVRMSDGSDCWIVTVFDLTTLTDGWCVELDAFSGDVRTSYTTNDGFFLDVFESWTARKGNMALWSMADKQLYDALYTLMPSYGLPAAGDISQEAALQQALAALALSSTDGYQVGYGYLMGGEGYNGVWEIILVQNGQIAYQVNMDAVTGEIFYMHPDEAGNG